MQPPSKKWTRQSGTVFWICRDALPRITPWCCIDPKEWNFKDRENTFGHVAWGVLIFTVHNADVFYDSCIYWIHVYPIVNGKSALSMTRHAFLKSGSLFPFFLKWIWTLGSPHQSWCMLSRNGEGFWKRRKRQNWWRHRFTLSKPPFSSATIRDELRTHSAHAYYFRCFLKRCQSQSWRREVWCWHA